MENNNQNVIRFYLIANRLKEKIRNGWVEIKISKDRLESVAEHIYGCLILAIGLDSEYDLELDMFKVLKMITLHELEETIIKDFTIRDSISKEEKIKLGKEAVKEATKGLIKQEEIETLLDEFNKHETKESLFCYHIDKIECDFQAKVYDLQGVFDINNAKEDLAFYGDDAKRVSEAAKCASDYWIEYDKRLYNDDVIFKSLIEDIQKLKKL